MEQVRGVVEVSKAVNAIPFQCKQFFSSFEAFMFPSPWVDETYDCFSVN
jgi:hypothetical protein